MCVRVCAQQNYLTKMYLDGSIFLCKNLIFMSVKIIVILGITTTWMDIKTRF